MHRELLITLGSEWRVAIDNELEKLKQSDRMLLGDVAAIFVRSDSFLGRPEEDCNEENETYLAVFYPSKYSIVCNKSFGTMANTGSKWKLMSLNEFIEQVFEFNFTYLQMLYNSSSIYETNDIKQLRNLVNSEVKSEYNKDRFLRKHISLMYGVLNDFNKGKFRDDAFCRDRVFLVLKAMKTVDIFVDTLQIDVVSPLDEKEYNEFVRHGLESGKLKYGVLGELNHRTAEYSTRLEKKNIALIDKDELKVYKLETKYRFMKNILDNIIK